MKFVKPLKTISIVLAFASVIYCSCKSFAATPKTYDVQSYGAKADGVSLDTVAINQAIEAAASAGGGTVTFPAGTYLSTSIHLKSKITLYLDQGATIKAAPQSSPGYDAPEPNPAAGSYQDFGHTHFHNSLIWGDGLENISILGPGRIWGDGLVRDYFPLIGSANKAICLKLCRNVIFRDFTIQHGGWFGILATGDDNVTVDNLKIDTNRDGMDIDCCRNVRISNCSVNSPNDDGICLKSSFGLGFARATENVTITNCLVSGFLEGSVLDGTYQRGPSKASPTGRIKLGTESNGGFINIAISNCVFENCRGLALETVDGATLEDIAVSNITMRDIFNSPIFLRLGARMRGPVGSPSSELRRVTISNVTVYNAAKSSACLISGIAGHPIQDLNLSNIQIWYEGGANASDSTIVPPELVNGYPEPRSFGETPAYGLYARHVEGITLDNIQFHTNTPDGRPPIVFSDVTGVRSFNTDGVPAN